MLKSGFAKHTAWKWLILPLTISLTHVALAEDMASQTMLSQTCSGCHGTKGHSYGPASPSIGGQSEVYLTAVLLGYKYYNDPDALDKVLESPVFKDEKYEDMEVFPRYGTIMGRIMAGYSTEEIVEIAKYYAKSEWQNVSQTADTGMASTGKKIHKKFCEKCHEDGGTSNLDGVGILAGQWTQYLKHTLADYREGRNKMPKKMKTKLEEMVKAHSDAGVAEVINFYANQ